MKLRVFFLSAICLAVAACAVAQNRSEQGGQRPGRPGNRGQFDQVVDTAIINHMDLPAATIEKVLTLQKNKQEAMRQQMQRGNQNKGQRLSEEERKALQEERGKFTAQYRKELRALLGDDAYIAYLEKQLDARPRQAMAPRQGGPGRAQQGLQQRNQMQRQMQQESFNQGFND